MLISCGWRRLDVRRLMNPECALEHGGGHNHTLYGSFPPFCSSANLVGRIHERFARSCIQSEWNQLRHYSPFNQIRVIKTNSLKQTGARRGIVFFFAKKENISSCAVLLRTQGINGQAFRHFPAAFEPKSRPPPTNHAVGAFGHTIVSFLHETKPGPGPANLFRAPGCVEKLSGRTNQ
jgi:hypothetical protein